MRILITAQAVDESDHVVGFFVRWIEALAPHYERIEVIALKKGRFDLPDNVRVHSLGKEQGRPLFGSIVYAFRLIRLAWRLRDTYDIVFVHQVQEHLLAAGWLWKLLRKPVYLWRNHYRGNVLTDIAALFCRKVFFTSHASHTAKYKRGVRMPVGIDLSRFVSVSAVRAPRSVLFLARFSPAKKPHLFIEALGVLKQSGVTFSASVYGPTDPKDEAYRERVIARARELGLDNVTFFDGVSHEEAARVFASHEVYVNLMGGGAYDKTIFEAAASGCTVLAVSPDFAELSGEPALPADAEGVAARIERAVVTPEAEKRAHIGRVREAIRYHDLTTLARKLHEEMR